MKLFKKIAVFGITACLAAGMIAFTACKDNDSGELTDAQWAEKLTLNIDNIKSGTFVVKSYPTYSKEQAAEYGEWETNTETTTVDFVNGIFYQVEETEKYNSQNNTFNTEKRELYMFSYKNAYYCWSKMQLMYNNEP